MSRLDQLYDRAQQFDDEWGRRREADEETSAHLWALYEAASEGLTLERWLCRGNGGPCRKKNHDCMWKSYGVLKDNWCRTCSQKRRR